MNLDELIIKEVKKYDILYNTQSKDYRKIELKEKAWKEIANNVKAPVDFLKKRWKNLKDGYNRYKIKKT
ncbi:transcription factor Adf-1-like [Lucilia sericata]|uniref:transcription factor Adf-1-like n=1 Tax=Lucilia sericata TaxID=13632 RepID=UPI0018A85719|nr:transcription factor Adf-1-like [Lucilia sericata]